MSRLHDLPFDQYQRYQLVSLLVDELREKGESLAILDVGGRTALLRGFLKHDRVTLVDLEPSSEKGLVLGDGAALPFADRSFDLVCAFDTLEHVPPPQRARFVRECVRVARRWVVLAGPYQSAEVEEAEELLQKFLRDKLGVRHRYLEEHRHHGLPVRATVEAQLEKLGARVASLGHGNVQRWLGLISLSMYMDHTPALQAQAVRLQRFYNRGLFAEDFDEPVYRHAIVAALGEARLPKQRAVHAHSRPPARELLHFAQELAAFDAHRDGYQAEFERLQSVVQSLASDLEGHKRTLAETTARRDEAQRAVRDLTSDLEGHKRTLAEAKARREEAQRAVRDLASDLEGHRKSLREASAGREEAAAVIAALQSDLAGHRATLEELRAQRAESEKVIAGLQRDLEGHRGTLHELSQSATRYEGLLEEHREVIREREGELQRHGRVLEELRGHLAALDSEQSKVLGLRDSERREFDAVRSELAREIESLQDVRGELERELSSRVAHAAELEQLLAREHAAFEAQIATRDAELGRHAEQQRALRADLEQHRKVLAERERVLTEHREALSDVRSDLEGHRTTVAAQRAELEQVQAREADLRGELTHARDQIADLHGALERARAELRDAAGALQAKEELIGLLRGELKSRVRSLRRALGPARPTPGE